MIDNFNPTHTLEAAQELSLALLPLVFSGIGLFLMAAYLG